MGIKRASVFIFLPLLCASLLYSQSLAEIAKKEKERRAKLKQKSAKVVTNADLAMRKRAPALTVIRAYTPAAKSTEALSAPKRRALERTSPGIDRESQTTLEELRDRSKKADEYVELLTLKMNGLWQKFYSFRDWTLRDEIQRDMAETFQKLQKAKQDAARARRDLETRRSRKRR
ncbi:MAG: hypothetical protein ACE5L7_06285 [Candidatus Aminicenantales bacterium]